MQHLEIQRLGIAMDQMLGAFILDFGVSFATGTSSTATREVEVSPFIPEGFAAFGDSGSQGVI